MATPRKKSGRNKLPADQRRSEMEVCRLTTSEKKTLRENANKAGLSVSDYLRRRALGHRIEQVKAQADASLISELNKIGVNVNQLARATHRNSDMQIYYKEIGAELQRVLATVAARYGS